MRISAARVPGSPHSGLPGGPLHGHACEDSCGDSDVDEAALVTCHPLLTIPAEGAASAADGNGRGGGASQTAVAGGCTLGGADTAACDYHIVYHHSFRVPVMCILARHLGKNAVPYGVNPSRTERSLSHNINPMLKIKRRALSSSP